jgi:phage tail protein X
MPIAKKELQGSTYVRAAHEGETVDTVCSKIYIFTDSKR